METYSDGKEARFLSNKHTETFLVSVFLYFRQHRFQYIKKSSLVGSFVVSLLLPVAVVFFTCLELLKAYGSLLLEALPL